jgi:hypothetical protein
MRKHYWRPRANASLRKGSPAASLADLVRVMERDADARVQQAKSLVVHVKDGKPLTEHGAALLMKVGKANA